MPSPEYDQRSSSEAGGPVRRPLQQVTYKTMVVDGVILVERERIGQISGVLQGTPHRIF